MRIKLTYKQKIFTYFTIIFTLFSAGIIIFEQRHERNVKTEELRRQMENNIEIVHNYISTKRLFTNNNWPSLDSLLAILPKNIRFTVINQEGTVLHDSELNPLLMSNHLNRPEIAEALESGRGVEIRKSESDNIKYIYHAKYYNNLIIRAALPYDIEVSRFFSPSNAFLYFTLLFFALFVVLLNYISSFFGKSIERIRDLSSLLAEEKAIPTDIHFPDDELGAISSNIVRNHLLLQSKKEIVITEREKLLQHMHYSDEGIAIFSAEYKKIYANAHFIQYINIILDQSPFDVESIFQTEEFSEIYNILNGREESDTPSSPHLSKMGKSGKQFTLRLIIFEDRSFEIKITDITKPEKTRLLKQEMTNNIAHELRTPVASIQGYLETVLHNRKTTEEQRETFIQKAYDQTCRLTNIIQDVSIITKTEEAPEMFTIESVKIRDILEELYADLCPKLTEQAISFENNISPEVRIEGSPMLLYSIFRNLIDNSISYAGNNIKIVIESGGESDEYYHFLYYDTGIGVSENHLCRIFERFYRINEGRTRNTGGSGLGLSIVKNAITFHRGRIIAKNRISGGLEFIFTLSKEMARKQRHS